MTTSKKATSKDDLLELLRGGVEGIAKYNDMVAAKKKRPSLKDAELAGEKLTSADFSFTDLRGADFTGCDLENCKLDNADVSGANFAGANIKNASGFKLKAISTTFNNATADGASFIKGDLQNSSFSNASCNRVDFCQALLYNAKFDGALMEDVRFDQTHFDEKTVLPENLLTDGGLLWKGIGPHPSQIASIRNEDRYEALDFGKLLEHLEVSIEKERLKKAIKMLKAESFQLFSEVSEARVVGVVKSQTDPNLVYACILTNEGRFCCGTQNLNACGGLRGALCKHLLVLLLGLTNAGKMDAGDADKWTQISKLQQPKLDKDTMSEIFLRYKGAEAGEIDWRPTETIPEDYYAF